MSCTDSPPRARRAVMSAVYTLSLAWAPGCALEADEAPNLASSREPIIYGDDDRVEVYEHESGPLVALATQSVVALIEPALLEPRDGGWAPNPDPASEVLQLCEDEAFAAQPAVASCTGVLIDEDLVLTAGHCFAGPDDCGRYRYAFDYHYSRAGQAADLTDLDVYQCARTVAWAPGEEGSAGAGDYAIVQLSRAVDRRRVPVVLREESVRMGDSVAIIGFPMGVPAKIDSGAYVQGIEGGDAEFWTVNSDTFGGSSGAPAFDISQRLTGVLVQGGTDYTQDPEEGCLRARYVDDDEHYERIAGPGAALAAMCATDLWERPLCDGIAVPPPPVDAGPKVVELPTEPGAPVVGYTECALRQPARSTPRRHASLLVLALITAARVIRRRRS